MKGNIYVRGKCQCGGTFIYIEKRNGCYCEKCDKIATKNWYVCFGREIQRRFSHDFLGAERFLTGLRFKHDEGTLDPRDYKSGNPLGFSVQADHWLNKVKVRQLKRQSLVTYTGYINRAVDRWGNRNIKNITNGDIEDFLLDDHKNRYGDTISSKTRHEMKSVLVQFWKWVVRREKLVEMPEFPEIGFEMGFREIVDINTQTAIIDKVKELSWSLNPKIWCGGGNQIRTGEWRFCRPLPYHLAMPPV
jgi:hypothetical protein